MPCVPLLHSLALTYSLTRLQMCDGIDDSATVIVFVTQNYLRKVAGKGPKGGDDNCKRCEHASEVTRPACPDAPAAVSTVNSPTLCSGRGSRA